MAKVVGTLGKYLGPKVASIFGSGDYAISNSETVSSNALVHPEQTPKFSTTVQSFVMTKREFITNIVTSASANTFEYDVFQLNPGLSNTFPWLSQIAPNFETYKCHGLMFEFRSTSSDALNSTNTALGQVIMSCQYDAANPPFTN